MQPTIKAYDSSTWVLDNLVGIANNFNYDAYGYGVYYDTVHGDISASNPLLVNNLLERNTRVAGHRWHHHRGRADQLVEQQLVHRCRDPGGQVSGGQEEPGQQVRPLHYLAAPAAGRKAA